MRKILSYKAVQLVVVLIIKVILSVILTAVKDKEYSNWVSTEAVITDWKTGWHVSHIIYFEYEVGGTKYRGQDSFKGNFPNEDVGDVVTVWYDPDDASRVMRSDIKPDAGLWTYAPFFLAFPISIFVLSGGFKARARRIG